MTLTPSFTQHTHPLHHQTQTHTLSSQLVRRDDNTFTRVAAGRNVLQVLEDLGQFNTLLAALKV